MSIAGMTQQELDLRERVKELSCLYKIAELVELERDSVSGILQGTALILPPGFLYPEVAAARIDYLGMQYLSHESNPEPLVSLRRPIKVKDQEVGSVEVYYYGRVEGQIPSFIPEESPLLSAVAERLGHVIERIELEEKVRSSQNMEMIGQLASGIAHDFNNLLAGIMGYAQILTNQLHDTPNLHRYASGIHKACKRGAQTVSQLLVFARKEQQRTQTVDMNAVIDDVVGLLSHSIGPSIRISHSQQAQDGRICVDVGMLQGTLLNLGTNARDAMPDGGQLEFGSRNLIVKEDDHLVAALGLQPGPHLHAWVRDTGCGMKDAMQDHAKEAFFTTKADANGTGLGLTSVYACMKVHDGAMDISSVEGKGSTISLYFPQRTETANASSKEEESTPMPQGSGHVLVVDDESMVREMACDMLRHLGYEASACEDGVEAVRLCSAPEHHFDLVLLDLYMEKQGGLETIAKLQQMTKRHRLLVFSGHITKEVRSRLKKLGVEWFLEKPFDERELAAIVHTVLQQPISPITNEPGKDLAEHDQMQISSKAITRELPTVAHGSVKILVVDDDTMVRQGIQEYLIGLGYRVNAADSGESASDLLSQRTFDVILTDLQMGRTNGIDVLKAGRAHNPFCVVLIMTAFATVESSLEALLLGADDYFPKPVNMEHLELVIQRSVAERRLRAEHAALLQSTDKMDALCSMVGSSDAMNRVYRSIRTFSKLDSTVLIQGETGVGKELAAQALHALSDRCDEPFLAVNCGSLPDSLLEGELFGHMKGAFTGATADKDGLLAAAGRGTVFLDEIDAASPKAQAALLRALDAREIRPVGGRDIIPLRARVLVASNKNLDDLIEKDRFREDLYYRIAEGTIHMPPLRDRLEDIPLLADHFFGLVSSTQKQRRSFSPQCLDMLHRYAWPGNVRELKSLVTNLAATAPRPVVKPIDLPERIRLSQAEDTRLPTLDEQERNLLTKALEKCAGNKAEVARILGTTRTRVYSLMKKYNIAR